MLVYFGASESINRNLLETADWDGMLLGIGIAMVYAGLDQGNRLDWLGSGTVVACMLTVIPAHAKNQYAHHLCFEILVIRLRG